MKYLLTAIAVLFFLAAVVYANIRIFTAEPLPADSAYDKQQHATAALRDPLADPDNDGLENWEEDLYGSSKKSADSDGDGTSDGDEVARGTDPTSYLGDQNDIVLIKENLTTYEFQQTGNARSPEDLIKSFYDSSILTSEVPTQQIQYPELRACLNRFATIIDNALVTSPQDVEVINGYILGSSTNSYPLEAIVSSGQVAIEKLQQFDIATCPEITTHVIAMTDSYQTQVQEVGLVLQLSSASSSEAWTRYAEAVNLWVITTGEIRDIVAERQIIFTPTEPGRMFNPGQ